MTQLTPTIPDDALLASIEAAAASMAEEAGTLISGYFGKEITTEFKDEEQTNPVTQVDKESQAFLERSILERFPGHGVLGEEDEEVEGEGPLAPDFVWVLDPLDGTRNFMYGLPVYACSVGVLYRGSPVAGAVHVPWPGSSSGVVYHARAGGRTAAGGRPVRVFEAEQSEGRRIMAVPGSFGGMLRFRDGMHKNVGDLRMSGSLAYETAMTASGVLQYMITLSPKIWDVAAGVLLVQVGRRRGRVRPVVAPVGACPYGRVAAVRRLCALARRRDDHARPAPVVEAARAGERGRYRVRHRRHDRRGAGLARR